MGSGQGGVCRVPIGNKGEAVKDTIEELLAVWDSAVALEQEASDAKDEACTALQDARQFEYAASVKYHDAIDEANYQRKLAAKVGP